MGRVLAIGGGGFLMEDAASPIDAHILHLTGKPRPRICFIGTPSGDLPEHIEKFYAAGVLLAAVSAGAMCWFEAGLTDSYWGAGYQPLRCLGLLARGCAVHFNSEPGRRTRLHEALAAGAVPSTLAIDDQAAVLIENKAVVRALSWAPGKGAYRVEWVDGAVRETALACAPLPGGG